MHVRGLPTSENAARAAWMIFKGPIPDGLQILHNCDNPPCVNPLHLRLGTNRENQDDIIARKTHRFAKMTHCHRGHEFTPENTYRNSGRRHCKKCCALRTSKWKKKHA